MTEAHRTSEKQLSQLVDCLRHRPVATTAAQMREAADQLERLTTVALAAKGIVRSLVDCGDWSVTADRQIVALESALAAAGYDMTEEEFERAI